ncbi:MAG: AMP-binding protein [Candidatus Binatia bacterium]
MSLNHPLVQILCERGEPGRLVAFGVGSGGDASHERLLADVAALAQHLGGDRGSRWLVQTEDAYRVAVSLLAAATVGARIALPPNLQPGTLGELTSACDRVLVDSSSRSAGGPRSLDPLSPGHTAAATAPTRNSDGDALARNSDGNALARNLDRNAPLVDLFTSGTSGPGKLVTKSLCHLEDEVVELERTLGSDLAGSQVLATVPAHHLYGLLFRVLWPLAASRPFCRTSFLLPDDLLARVAQKKGSDPIFADSRPALGGWILVSSPAHLRHLAASARLAEHATKLQGMFSSGGPLETATALAIQTATGQAPIEIFGSTETGGVAWRRASAADPSPRWNAFAPVTIEISEQDRQLVVSSPFVTRPTGAPAGEANTWCLGDRAERDGDGFRLLGRSDRIAKIGEKTLLLPEIEASLAAHDLVEAAAVGTYRERSGLRLGAIVVLSTTGRRRLAAEGRRALQAQLSAHLAERWDRVALPRRWRFPDALPVDARGKTTQAAFEGELARGAGEILEPLLLSQRSDGSDVVCELVVPRDLAYLAGHYDAFPLVPGAVQIQWVLLAAGRLLGCAVSAQRMEAIKFKNVLRPAQEFTMRLHVDEDAGTATRVAFTLAHEARIFSSGRITLAV